MKNPNYADGQAGAVYGQNPPLVNPTRKPGEWQAYDIVFHQPVFEGDKCVHPGSLTVFLNGVLVQDHWEIEGPTWHMRRTRQEKPRSTKGSIQFQDHGNPVHFRNVWVREIPSRYANTTHGTYLAKEKDVAAQRRATAERLLAGIDAAKCDSQQVHQILEVVSYCADCKFMDAAKRICGGYLKKLDPWQGGEIERRKNEIRGIRRAYDTLGRNGLAKDCPLGNKVREVCRAKGWR
jgi:hypothetical protein